MHRGEHRRDGPLCWCGMSSNAFLARRETIVALRWDPAIKTYEHWEFFYRASQIEGLAIAVATDCFIHHAHVHAKDYRDILQAIRWDERLKVEENWDFFWRAKIACVNVGVATDHLFRHVHADPPEYVRRRPEFLEKGKKIHGLRKVVWR